MQSYLPYKECIDCKVSSSCEIEYFLKNKYQDMSQLFIEEINGFLKN